MAQPKLIQDGIVRVQSAVKELDKRYRRLQKQAERRRKAFEKQAEQRVRRLQTELRKNPLVKRAEDLREGAARRIEEQVEQVLATLRIASQAEVERLDKKVAQLNRKLREIERAQEAA